jgi:hypothetical protein
MNHPLRDGKGAVVRALTQSHLVSAVQCYRSYGVESPVEICDSLNSQNFYPRRRLGLFSNRRPLSLSAALVSI